MREYAFKIINIVYKCLCVVIPVKKNRIIMECDYGKGFYGNLLYIYEEINKQNLDYQIIIPINKGVKVDISNKNTKVIKSRGIKHFYYLITSKYWLINNHYYYFLKKRNETICINTWHALGAFKKFGLDCNDNKEEEHKKDGENIDCLLVSSKKLASIYSQALNVDISKIVSIGIPRTDILFNIEMRNALNKKLKKEFNSYNKKIILYAPTFRDGEKYCSDIRLDMQYMRERLGEDYLLLVKLHPIIRTKIKIPDELNQFVFDVSKYDMNELLVFSDVLITDYSSVIFDYALLEKPIIFFAYDLDEFKEKSREFYFEYEDFIPDNYVKTTEDVIEKILHYKNNDNFIELRKIKEFGEQNCEYKDGKSSERFVKRFLIDM